jgi:hypothetical protein
MESKIRKAKIEAYKNVETFINRVLTNLSKSTHRRRDENCELILECVNSVISYEIIKLDKEVLD